MNQFEYLYMSEADRRLYDVNQMANIGLSSHYGMMDINASTETVYPCKNGNSMNKKLASAKKWLKDRMKETGELK